jgi:hypothetical protein
MSKTRKHRLFLLASALLINMLLPLQVHADGGAPDLAYVAGAAQGVGIIDVAQRKLATKFTIAGDPFSILLSPDGRLLYVTQPAPGRVAALAAKTGQTICNAPYWSLPTSGRAYPTERIHASAKSHSRGRDPRFADRSLLRRMLVFMEKKVWDK